VIVYPKQPSNDLAASVRRWTFIPIGAATLGTSHPAPSRLPTRRRPAVLRQESGRSGDPADLSPENVPAGQDTAGDPCPCCRNHPVRTSGWQARGKATCWLAIGLAPTRLHTRATTSGRMTKARPGPTGGSWRAVVRADRQALGVLAHRLLQRSARRRGRDARPSDLQPRAPRRYRAVREAASSQAA
jgi:hypothetical protein